MKNKIGGKITALALAILFGAVFIGTKKDWTMGICMGLCMGVALGLFDDWSLEKETPRDGEPDGETSPEERENGIRIRPLEEGETDAALALAWKVFSVYESPDYPPEGTEEFRKTLSDADYLAGLRYYGAFDGERLVGLLAIREAKRHICFFFVDGDYHRRGIGTNLFRRMREDYPHEPITLNSSPYGLPFYRALGFVPIGEEQTVRGIRFTPMIFRGEAEKEDA
ncbi:MAG: GNAT family N-acetyltransferase [Clostridia bacterium]|nr:GNAT family N-acetyltransferase [Clostridia bacterium]